jgi:hypothetical protein
MRSFQAFAAPRFSFILLLCGLAEASLSGVEPLMQKIQSEIRRVDASILAAVRQQVRGPVVSSFISRNALRFAMPAPFASADAIAVNLV